MKKIWLVLFILIIPTLVYAEGIDSNTVLMLHGDGDDSFSIGEKYAKFDGVNDYVNCGAGSSLIPNSNSWFISAWFKIDSFHDGTLLSRYGGENCPDYNGIYLLSVTNEGNIYGWMRQDNAVSQTITYPINTGWHHAVLGRDIGNNQFVLYLDGVLVNSSSLLVSGSMTKFCNKNMYLGQYNGWSGPESLFKGNLDDIAIYNQALTASDVSKIFNNGVEGNNITTGMISHYLMDSDFSDIIGSNEGTASGAYITKEGHTYTANGNPQLNSDTKKFGSGSMQFDGSGDYLTIADSDDWYFGSDDFTIDFWLKTSSTEQDYLVSHWQGGGGSERDFGCHINNPLGSLTCWVNIADANYDVTSVSTVNDGNWHHISFLRDGNDFKLFIDGNLEDSFINSGALWNSGQLLRIGRYDGTSGSIYDYTGQLDELRISKGTAR